MAEIAVSMHTWGGDMGPEVGSIVFAGPDGYEFSELYDIDKWVANGNAAADFNGKVGLIHAPNIPYAGILHTEYHQQHQTREVVTGAVTHQYKYKIDLLAVPTPWAEDLASDYVITVNWNLAQLQAFTKNRATGLMVG